MNHTSSETGAHPIQFDNLEDLGGGRYKLVAQFPPVNLEISKVEESRLAASAEFKITTDVPGLEWRGCVFRQKLLEPRHRDDNVRYLARVGPQTPELQGDVWRQVIERGCYEAVDAHRKGVKEINMSKHEPDMSGAQWRLRPFLEEGEATVLFGLGDSGKSFLGLYWGYLVASWKADLGMEPDRGAVMICDYETTVNVTSRRSKMIADGFGEARPEGLIYLKMHQTLKNDYERVKRAVDRNKIKLLIVDSAAMATGEPESSEVTNEFFLALRDLGTTNLVIAHVAKTGRDHEPFGSVFWSNMSRSTFRATATRPGRDTLTVKLRNHKSNNVDRLRDRAFDLQFEDSKVVVTTADPEAVVDDAESSTAHRVLTLLSRGALSANEIAEQLDLKPNQVHARLKELKDAGKVMRFDNKRGGKWGRQAY